ncbi:MAG: cobalamin-dependent protein [Candidatus Omnitrophica bacterium]|nr:cobalamin-dependent protein [Candidatus Omnitrophota bacterium]
MKVAFISDSTQCLGIKYPGIRSLSAILKDAGHEVKLFVDPLLFQDSHCSLKKLSRMFDFKKELLMQLKNYQPHLVGMTVTTETYPWACAMAALIKQAIKVPVIWGGIHPTSVPEQVIRNDNIDMVCIGEGEYPILELADSMEKGQIDYAIKNLWFKKNGKIIKNELRPLLQNLDALPIPDPELYAQWEDCLKIGYYIAASRGCPNQCSYCCHSYLHQLYQGEETYVRKRSVHNVIKELLSMKKKYAMKRVIFTDDCFAHDKDWLREFAVEYKEKIFAPFFCTMQPSDVTQETVSYLQSAGCRMIALGVQSWDKQLRENLMNRYVSNVRIEEAIKLIKGSRIQLAVDNLFGLPGQSCEEVIQLNMRYTYFQPNRIFFFQLKYYPSTPILSKAVEKGFVSAGRYEDIVKGIDPGGVQIKTFFSKKDPADRDLMQMKMFLFSFDLLPGKVIRFLAEKKLYRWFPICIDISVLMLFRTLLSRDFDSRQRIEEALYKYGYFMKKKALSLLKGRK